MIRGILTAQNNYLMKLFKYYYAPDNNCLIFIPILLITSIT